jgi:hypothetical protein
MILETARVNISKTYALFGKNCEHFAKFCYNHEAESLQLQASLIVASLFAVAATALLSSSN